MAKLYDQIDERLQRFILDQRMFFVASAPLSGEGRVNLSPKGFDSFRILDPKTVAYLDYTGSGVESIAHIRENGRFVIMFCSFDEKPIILRLHGKGSVIERSDKEWAPLIKNFEDSRMARAIIKLAIERICDSCGWGVPTFEYKGERDQYEKYEAQLDDEGLRQDQLKWNMTSMDGLPGMAKTSV